MEMNESDKYEMKSYHQQKYSDLSERRHSLRTMKEGNIMRNLCLNNGCSKFTYSVTFMLVLATIRYNLLFSVRCFLAENDAV